MKKRTKRKRPVPKKARKKQVARVEAKRPPAPFFSFLWPSTGQAGKKQTKPTPKPKPKAKSKRPPLFPFLRPAPKKQEPWEELIYSREEMNMDDPAERSEFVNACLEQIVEAEREMDDLEHEYRTVTAYLRDLDEIDALPQKQRDEIRRLAQRIVEAGRGREQLTNREPRMPQAEFERMHRLEPKIGETILRMAQAEDYRKKVTNDLRRLDNERNAYEYRLTEIDRTVATSRSLTIFISILLMVLLVVLFALGRIFAFDVTYGYLLAILFTTIAVAALLSRSQGAEKERKGVTAGISRLIMLQNTVKIRYVNNQNLLNYMVLKYNVKNSGEFKKREELYLAEKEDRAKLKGTEETLKESQQAMFQLLQTSRIQYPQLWMRQASGLADPKEMVEVRHKLLEQRQSLRKRMDYNEHQVKGRARDEIERLARDYPAYADEILDMVARGLVTEKEIL